MTRSTASASASSMSSSIADDDSSAGIVANSDENVVDFDVEMANIALGQTVLASSNADTNDAANIDTAHTERFYASTSTSNDMILLAGERPTSDDHMSRRPRQGRMQRRNSCGKNLNVDSSDNPIVSTVQRTSRGSPEWRKLIKPFVSDLTFRSFSQRRAESEIYFQPYTCEAAILFIDLSGYSKINAALASKGAHAISSAVNAYFDRLIVIIERYGGDVVKFAGDLVFCVWEGQVGDDEDLEYNLLCACNCALNLQEDAGSHPVKGTDLEFRIHCGLTIGILESEVFAAPSHVHMQRLYHSVSGQCLLEISSLVDLAQAGDICISQDVADFLGEMAVYEQDEDVVGAYMLLDLEIEHSTQEAVEQHIQDIIADRASRRIPGMEEEFIHPKVLDFLTHGGQSPTQIAQMRNLCVLFIGMTSAGNSVNWLMEVQSILDSCRCPIVQLINDDKGVHIVAAVNLYESVPDSSLLALNACRELVHKQLGCAIGVAMGSTFCGVTGTRNACRWDITGQVPVRAARLMEHALAENRDVVIDTSLLNESIAATRMSIIKDPICVKGTEHPVTIYGLSKSNLYSVFRVLENPNSPITAKPVSVQKVRKSINTAIARCAVVVTGGPGAGMTLVCQRAATLSDLVPFSHVCDETAGMAQLARSIAIWFSYSKLENVRAHAAVVMDHMNNCRWSRAHDQCVNLIDMAVQAGLRTCFVLRRIQFLDSFSLSIMRECLKGRTFITGRNKNVYRRSSCGGPASLASADTFGGSSGESGHVSQRKIDRNKARQRQRRRTRESRMSGGSGGKIVFLGCHTTLYKHKPAKHIVNEITRSSSSFQIKIVELCQSSLEERKAAIYEACDIKVSDRWLRHNPEATGLCVSSLFRRANKTIEDLSKTVDVVEQVVIGNEVVTKELVLDAIDGNKSASSLARMSGGDVMKLTQSFDELSPIMQVFLKVVAIASRRALFNVPKTVAVGVTNDLVGRTKNESMESNSIMKDLEEMKLLKVDLDGGFEMVVFPIPALADIVMDVCTPVQIHSIASALIYRLSSMQFVNFKIPFMIAELYNDVSMAGGVSDEEVLRKYWRKGMGHFQSESSTWKGPERSWWLKQLSESIASIGGDPSAIMGDDLPTQQEGHVISRVPRHILLIKLYKAPISFGPLGHTLSAIARSIFQTFGALVRGDDVMLLESSTVSYNITARYREEVDLLERFLTEHNQPISPTETDRNKLIEDEYEALASVSNTPNTPEEAREKAESFLCDFVSKYVDPRIERLRLLAVTALDAPKFLKSVARNETLSTAFEKLSGKSCWKDSTEDALMILATRNWKPRKIPESLPPLYHQTVCRLRDAVLKQKNETSSQHDSTFHDFAAFIIASAVLEEDDIIDSSMTGFDGQESTHDLQASRYFEDLQ